MADAPAAEYQIALLELAFDAASAMPLNPHIKNRSKAQAQVVETAFELDQPKRVLAYAEQIADWRRALGIARYAEQAAKRGLTPEAQSQMDRAQEIADHPIEENQQDWHRERILMAIARARHAADSRAGVPPAALSESEFDARASELETSILTSNLDQARAALEKCVVLYGDSFGDQSRRERLATKVTASIYKLPLTIQVESLCQLGEVAVEHGDAAQGREFAKLARERYDSASWTPQYGLPLVACIAKLRHGAGEQERARKELDEGLAWFEQERAKLPDVFRAGALRPVAEALVAMGDAAAAAAMYARAVEEGSANPNSRPRAEDLVATCCSMAIQRVEPNTALWARLRAIRSALADPW